MFIEYILLGGGQLRNKLREIRMKEYLLDVGEFARLLNINIKTYSNWEKERSQPKLQDAIRVAKKLNKKVEEIWVDED